MAKYTDLAMEARQIWQEDADDTTKLSGVKARTWSGRGLTTTTVEILSAEGVRALGKPMGTYITLEWKKDLLRDPDSFSHTALFLGKILGRLVPKSGPVLVVGLGNRAVTPDAFGPRVLDNLVVTRHLEKRFPQLRPVSAIAPGVLGTTGLESAQIVRGIVENFAPGCVIAVDALASAEPSRLCTAVQITDTGITPGSGVGNHRLAFDKASLGVPVLAVGVPTVVEAGTLLQGVSGENAEKPQEDRINIDKSMIVTPRDIDAKIDRAAKLVGYGISLALHKGMTMTEVSCIVN